MNTGRQAMSSHSQHMDDKSPSGRQAMSSKSQHMDDKSPSYLVKQHECANTVRHSSSVVAELLVSILRYFSG